MLDGLREFDPFDKIAIQNIGAVYLADEFCEENAHLASDATLRRKRQTQRWLSWAEALWENSEKFEAVVRSGRYSRLRSVIERLCDADDRAWRRLKDEILRVCAREFLCEAESDPIYVRTDSRH